MEGVIVPTQLLTTMSPSPHQVTVVLRDARTATCLGERLGGPAEVTHERDGCLKAGKEEMLNL